MSQTAPPPFQVQATAVGHPPAPANVTLLQGATQAVLPPAQRARRVAFALSIVAVLFSLGCGICGRRAFALQDAAPDLLLPWVLAFLSLLLLALLLRMAAAVGELWWLERTWSNLPEALRNVGPVKDVSSGMAIAITLLPGVAWVWKLGIVIGIADGFEAIRTSVPFSAPVPRRLGMAAVIVGWVPGLNVYLAPFLWEMFARRIDLCVEQIMATRAATATSGAPT